MECFLAAAQSDIALEWNIASLFACKNDGGEVELSSYDRYAPKCRMNIDEMQNMSQMTHNDRNVSRKMQ